MCLIQEEKTNLDHERGTFGYVWDDVGNDGKGSREGESNMELVGIGLHQPPGREETSTPRTS